MDIFRANFGAALRDIAEADAQFVLEQFGAGDSVQRMHLEPGDSDKETRPPELFFFVVLAQNVANILAEEAFDAFAKFLHAVDVRAGDIFHSTPGRGWNGGIFLFTL